MLVMQAFSVISVDLVDVSARVAHKAVPSSGESLTTEVASCVDCHEME